MPGPLRSFSQAADLTARHGLSSAGRGLAPGASAVSGFSIPCGPGCLGEAIACLLTGECMQIPITLLLSKIQGIEPFLDDAEVLDLVSSVDSHTDTATSRWSR